MALGNVRESIKKLNQQVIIAASQETRRSQRQELLTPSEYRRTDWHAKFLSHLNDMDFNEKSRLRFGEPNILWEALDIRPSNLENKNIANPLEPGDSFVFEDRQIVRATNIAKDYYDAWSESIVKSIQQHLTSTKGLPKVGTLTRLANICLVLNLLNKRELLDRFFREEDVASDLPLSQSTLERLFDDEYEAQRFVTEQYRVVSRTWTDGSYLEIPKEEPLPFQIEHEYGHGSFGTVYKVRDVRTNKRYARKEQRYDDGDAHFHNEKNTMGKAHHRHVIRYVKAFKRGWRYNFLLEPAADGNLSDLLCEYRKSSKSTSQRHTKSTEAYRRAIMKFFGCTAIALCHVQQKMSIIHKDIKPSNILYHVVKKEYCAILADFGLAHDFSRAEHTGTDHPRKWSMKYAAPGRLDGSWIFPTSSKTSLSPENELAIEESKDSKSVASTDTQKKPPHGRKDDVFSLGCVFLEILSTLVESKIPGADADDFEFSAKMEVVEKWAISEKQKESCPDSLKFLFDLSLCMARMSRDDRLEIADISCQLKESRFRQELFCSDCQREIDFDKRSNRLSNPPERNNMLGNQRRRSRSRNETRRRASRSRSAPNTSRSAKDNHLTVGDKHNQGSYTDP